MFRPRQFCESKQRYKREGVRGMGRGSAGSLPFTKVNRLHTTFVKRKDVGKRKGRGKKGVGLPAGDYQEIQPLQRFSCLLINVVFQYLKRLPNGTPHPIDDKQLNCVDDAVKRLVQILL